MGKQNSRLFNYLMPSFFAFIIIIISILNASNLISSFEDSTEIFLEDEDANVTAFLNAVEDSYSENFLAKDNYVDLNGGWARLMDIPLYNDRIKLNNGVLATIKNEIDMTEYSQNTTYFSEYLNSNNIPYLYVLAPTNYLSDDSELLPVWVKTYANRNIDNMMNGLIENDINALSFKDYFISGELNFENAYFNTDHHWTIPTAFYAHEVLVNKICEILEEKIVIDQQFYNLEKFSLITYEDLFLGYSGTRTGVLYAGGDDFTSVVPNFDTNFTIEIQDDNSMKTGNFEEVFVNRQGNVDFSAKYNTSVYSRMTMDTTDEYVKIVNHNSTNDVKLFVIGDSFATSIIPFLALHFDEVHLYDPRYGDASEERMLEKISLVEPTLVITMHSHDTLYQNVFTDILSEEDINLLESSRK